MGQHTPGTAQPGTAQHWHSGRRGKQVGPTRCSPRRAIAWGDPAGLPVLRRGARSTSQRTGPCPCVSRPSLAGLPASLPFAPSGFPAAACRSTNLKSEKPLSRSSWARRSWMGLASGPVAASYAACLLAAAAASAAAASAAAPGPAAACGCCCWCCCWSGIECAGAQRASRVVVRQAQGLLLEGSECKGLRRAGREMAIMAKRITC